MNGESHSQATRIKRDDIADFEHCSTACVGKLRVQTIIDGDISGVSLFFPRNNIIDIHL